MWGKNGSKHNRWEIMIFHQAKMFLFLHSRSNQSTLFSGKIAGDFNSLLNNKFLNRTKLKAFAEGKLNVTVMMISLLRVKNTMGKKENAGYQHFLLFP